MNQLDTGILLNAHDIKLHRQYFNEMVKLLGIQVLYRPIKPNGKDYNSYGELDALYDAPLLVGCIFEEHPNQKTMRKLGWNSEQEESTSLIHLPYDIERLQAGNLIIVPSGIDNAQGRVFKILKMSNIMVYPASICCEIGPVYETEFENSQKDYSQSNFNLLAVEEGDDD